MTEPTRVVVPSYRRAETCRAKTLTLLAERGQPPELIDVVVADQQDADAYGATLAPGSYGRLRMAVPGIRAVRNWVVDNYPEGSRIVCMDDDVSDLRQRLNATTTEPVPDLPALWAEGFYYADQVGTTLWGIYPVLNAMFMKPKVRTGLCYVVALCMGLVVEHQPHAYVQLDDKEDFERSIRYYLRHGALARLEWVAPRTRYYTEPGGNQVTRTAARVDSSARQLVAWWPELCSLNTTKKSGHTEVRLRDRR